MRLPTSFVDLLVVMSRGQRGTSTCATEYDANVVEWFKNSGMPTKVTPRTHTGFPSSYTSSGHQWVDDLTQSSDYGYTDEALDTIFGHAREQLHRCWGSGGRYWEVDLQFQRYWAMIAQDHSELAEAFHGCFSARFGKGFMFPLSWDLSVCAPRACNGKEVAHFVVPRYLVARVCNSLNFILPPPPFESVILHELSDWSQISLDFVIMGVDNCGTNSLRMNLEKHPDVGFTRSSESDQFFILDTQRRTLPLLSQVETFNQKWRAAGYTERPRILGLSHGGLFNHRLARLALAFVPLQLAILVVCDPLGRLEKEFMRFHYCGPLLRTEDVPIDARGHDANDILPRTGPMSVGTTHSVEHQTQAYQLGGSRQKACSDSISAVLQLPEFLEMVRVGPHLDEMKMLFGSRLVFFHQEYLRVVPSEVYSLIVETLGATSPFDADTQFLRYNSRRGHRTDLCHNKSLVRVLQEALSNEYVSLEGALTRNQMPIPEQLTLRQTRCDRAEELEDPMPQDRCNTPLTACSY